MRLGDLITACEDVLQVWEVSFEGCPCITLDCSVVATEGDFSDVLTEDFRNREVLSINGGKNCTKVLIKG
jgi:hypothetical protein